MKNYAVIIVKKEKIESIKEFDTWGLAREEMNRNDVAGNKYMIGRAFGDFGEYEIMKYNGILTDDYKPLYSWIIEEEIENLNKK